MSSTIPRSRNGNALEPAIALDELDADERRLVASFIELVRSWRGAGKATADEFQLLWQRMKSAAPETLRDDDMMQLALEGQGTIRRARV